MLRKISVFLWQYQSYCTDLTILLFGQHTWYILYTRHMFWVISGLFCKLEPLVTVILYDVGAFLVTYSSCLFRWKARRHLFAPIYSQIYNNNLVEFDCSCILCSILSERDLHIESACGHSLWYAHVICKAELDVHQKWIPRYISTTSTTIWLKVLRGHDRHHLSCNKS